MNELFTLPAGVATRWASPENFTADKGAAGKVLDGRKGSSNFSLKAGESRVLAQCSGVSGTIRRIWVTVSNRSAKMLRGLRLEMFWDGATRPAVAAPLGDFFGHTLGRMSTFQSAFFSSPEGRSFNCCLPMPFRTGMKIVLTNQTDTDLPMVFYDVNFTIGDPHPADVLYFHAHWRRENPTTMLQDYPILPALAGKGRFLGSHIGVKTDTEQWFSTWWGEGEVKIYLDGDQEFPTLCGTGTEDYIGTGWGQGQYAHLYQGCHLADHEKMQYGFYRLHVPDPVYFHKDIRVTIQQIGCWAPDTIARLRGHDRQLMHGNRLVDMQAMTQAKGYGIFERTDDWSSCAYLYFHLPENTLPFLPPASARLEKME